VTLEITYSVVGISQIVRSCAVDLFGNINITDSVHRLRSKQPRPLCYQMIEIA